MLTRDVGERAHRAAPRARVAELAQRPRRGLDHGHVGIGERADQRDRGARVVGQCGRELRAASTNRGCGIGEGAQPRRVRVVGRGPHQGTERRGADARVGVVVDRRDQTVVRAAVEGGVVAEGGELGGAGDRARVAHGSRPLMAITRPANTVASTAATRKPVNPTSSSMRTKAVPRRATFIPRVGPERAPNGIGGVAGCGVGVPVKTLDSCASRAHGRERNSTPLTGAA